MSDLDIIITQLSHEDSKLRMQAIRALGNTDDSRHLELLGMMLEDDSVAVIRTTAFAIGAIGGCEAWHYLQPLLKHESVWVRKATIEAIGRAHCADAVPILVNLLGNNDLDALVREALIKLKVDPDFF